MAQRTTVEFEEHYPPLDKWARYRVVPINSGLTIHLSDITEKKERELQIQRQHERLQTVLESLPIILFALDENGRYTLSQGQGLENLGLNSEECLGGSALQMYAGTPIAEDLQRALDGDALHTTHEAGDRVFESWYQPVENDRSRDQVVGVSVDITERQADRHALELSQARFRSLTESVSFAVVSINEHNVVQYANDAVKEMFGYTPDEMIGESLDMIVPDRLERTHNGAVGRYLRENQRHIDWEWVELPACHRDGHEFPVGVSLGEYVDGDDHVFTAVLRDITERKQSERSLLTLHDATRELMRAETLTEVGVIAAEAADGILDFPINILHFYDEATERLVPLALSTEALALFGNARTIDTDDTVAGRVFETGDLQLRNDIHRSPNAADEETPIRSELVLPLGEYGVFTISSTVADGIDETNVALAKALAANIEVALNRADHEAELRRQNEQLEEFANVISHDLRNPLGVAQGYLELARESGEEEDFEKVTTAQNRMEAIIGDVLTLARQGRTIGTTTPVSLSAVATNAWNSVGTGSAELLCMDDLGSIRADESRLEQLFENLFRNAIEHGGTKVTVRLGRSATGFYVEDDGPGIPAEKRTEIFEHGYSTNHNGTGFGLAIVRRVTTAHGWEIEVNEAGTGGARFDIAL